jgi:general transcription factor 3C polypeptide 3 (transcription factor C subunit 4)
MIGLLHLAIPFYERCLELSEEVRKEAKGESLEDFAIEAAYNLQQFWANSGELQKARAIGERWLVI